MRRIVALLLVLVLAVPFAPTATAHDCRSIDGQPALCGPCDSGEDHRHEDNATRGARSRCETKSGWLDIPLPPWLVVAAGALAAVALGRRAGS